MNDGLNIVNNTQKVASVLENQDLNDKFEGNKQKLGSQDLLNESHNLAGESKQKTEEAQKLLHAAGALEKIANTLRTHAQGVQNGETEKDRSIQEVSKAHEAVLQVPIPKDATPETLLDMAEKYERKAKDNRARADDLLIQAEEAHSMSTQLEKHAGMLNKKDMKLNELSFKQALAHNEGLNMVFKKLGIYKLDTEYKAQVQYAEKKAKEMGLPT